MVHWPRNCIAMICSKTSSLRHLSRVRPIKPTEVELQWADWTSSDRNSCSSNPVCFSFVMNYAGNKTRRSPASVTHKTSYMHCFSFFGWYVIVVYCRLDLHLFHLPFFNYTCQEENSLCVFRHRRDSSLNQIWVTFGFKNSHFLSAQGEEPDKNLARLWLTGICEISLWIFSYGLLPSCVLSFFVCVCLESDLTFNPCCPVTSFTHVLPFLVFPLFNKAFH